mgnify:CR=1 FL=1
MSKQVFSIFEDNLYSPGADESLTFLINVFTNAWVNATSQMESESFSVNILGNMIGEGSTVNEEEKVSAKADAISA